MTTSLTPVVPVSGKSLFWQLAPADAATVPSDGWIDAEVPGAVQLDWAKARGWGPWYYGGNFRDYEGLEDRHWFYRAPLPESVTEGRRLLFRCGGVDYKYEVWADEHLLLAQEGMQQPVEVDLTEVLGKADWLYVHLFPPPKK